MKKLMAAGMAGVLSLVIGTSVFASDFSRWCDDFTNVKGNEVCRDYTCIDGNAADDIYRNVKHHNSYTVYKYGNEYKEWHHGSSHHSEIYGNGCHNW